MYTLEELLACKWPMAYGWWNYSGRKPWNDKGVNMGEEEEHTSKEDLASDGEDVVTGVRPPEGHEEEDWEPEPTS